MPAAITYETWIERAVQRAGGVERVCALLGITRQGLWKARRRGTLPTLTDADRARVRKLSAASGIAEAKLVGLVAPPLPPRAKRRGGLVSKPTAAAARTSASARVALR